MLRVRTTEPLPRPIPEDTYLAIVDQLRTLRDRALVELMWEGGFRPGEVLGLQLEDISYGRRRIVIRYRVDHPQNVRQKSRRERVVDLWEERALPALNRYVMLERPQDTDCPYLFLVGGRGIRRDIPLSYNGLFRMFTRATTRAGVRTAWLTRISTQLFRHPVQVNSKRSLRLPHQGMGVSVGSSAWRSTGE